MDFVDILLVLAFLGSLAMFFLKFNHIVYSFKREEHGQESKGIDLGYAFNTLFGSLVCWVLLVAIVLSVGITSSYMALHVILLQISSFIFGATGMMFFAELFIYVGMVVESKTQKRGRRKRKRS